LKAEGTWQAFTGKKATPFMRDGEFYNEPEHYLSRSWALAGTTFSHEDIARFVLGRWKAALREMFAACERTGPELRGRVGVFDKLVFGKPGPLLFCNALLFCGGPASFL
jgi:hypothetical protein